MSELKACPCCGGEAKLVRVNHYPSQSLPEKQRVIVQHTKVECQICFISSAEFGLDKQAGAILTWNMRLCPAPERHNELREAVEREVETAQAQYDGFDEGDDRHQVQSMLKAEALSKLNMAKRILAALAEQAAPVATEGGKG